MKKHAAPGDRLLDLGLEILHEDRDVIVVDKPAGLLAIATEKDRERTAYFILNDYVRKGQARSRERVFIVHRLDRETSGVMIFARSEQAQARLQGAWDEVHKIYLAVVQGRMEKASGTIENYLSENSAHVVYPVADPAKGKLAKTAYRVIGRGADRTLVEVELLTGRKHQIRVHMAGLGHPIVGDKKYGPKTKGLATGAPGTRGGAPKRSGGTSRMALHSWSITFPHPFSGAMMTFKSKAPRAFTRDFSRETAGLASPPVTSPAAPRDDERDEPHA
jgi:RluA family pseudouridine synthase